MAEVGNMSLPSKLLKRGITDMVRISDARMSGTGYGTVVLHVCPEAAVGENLALAPGDDFIELDVESRRVHLDVSQDELERRRTQWQPPVNPMKGGYQQLYVERVMQANTGRRPGFLDGLPGQ
jgi:L-arabonate dehydrase